MGKVDPRITFWLGVITTLGQGVASGAVHLSGLIPAETIPYVTAWLGLIVFVNMTVLTAMSGLSAPGPGPIASPPTIDEARKVMAAAQAAKPGG